MDLEAFNADLSLQQQAKRRLAANKEKIAAIKAVEAREGPVRAKEIAQQYLLEEATALQDEAVNYKTQLLQSQQQFAQDALAAGAIGGGAAIAGAKVASALGRGAKTAAALTTGFDMAGQAAYDAGVRGLPTERVLLNAATTGVADVGALGAGRILEKVFDPGTRGTVVKAAMGRGHVLAPTAQQGSAGAKNAATTDFINPKITSSGEFLPSLEDTVVQSRFFDPSRNIYDPRTLQFSSGQLPTAQTIVDMKRDAIVSAVESIKASKINYMPALEEAYKKARSFGVKGIRLREILDPDTVEWIRSNARWSISQGKAASALDSIEALARDVASVAGVADPQTHAGLLKKYIAEGRNSASQIENTILDFELSPVQTNELLRKLQNSLVEAGSYDAKLAAALRQSNPSGAIADGSEAFDIGLAQRLEPRLQEALGRVEKETRLNPAVIEDPDVGGAFAGLEPDWLSQANRAQHAFIKLKDEYVSPLQGQSSGGQAGSAINAIPTSAEGVRDAAGKQVLNVWSGNPSVRGAKAAEDKFLEAAMLADAKLNPQKYNPAIRNSLLKAGLVGADQTLLYMLGAKGPRPLDRTTAAAEADPRGFADRIANHMLTKGVPPDVALMMGSEIYSTFSQPGNALKKKQVLGQNISMAPELFIPNNDGLNLVADGKFLDPMEQGLHVKNALEMGDLRKEADVVSGALNGKYVPINEGTAYEPMTGQMEPLSSPPDINLEYIDQSFQMPEPNMSQELMSYPATTNIVDKFKELAGEDLY